MPAMTDPQKPINDSEDYEVKYQCGCAVTFLGSDLHEKLIMTPCWSHGAMGRERFHERQRIVDKAINQLRVAKLNQPQR